MKLLKFFRISDNFTFISYPSFFIKISVCQQVRIFQNSSFSSLINLPVNGINVAVYWNKSSFFLVKRKYSSMFFVSILLDFIYKLATVYFTLYSSDFSSRPFPFQTGILVFKLYFTQIQCIRAIFLLPPPEIPKSDTDMCKDFINYHSPNHMVSSCDEIIFIFFW